MSRPPALAAGIVEQEGRRVLLAQRCDDCGATYFPASAMCPSCGSTDVKHLALAGTARIFSWTVVRRAGAGMKAPYAVAWVDFPEGPRLFGQLDIDPAEAKVGMEVEVAFGTPPAGAPLDGFHFVPRR